MSTWHADDATLARYAAADLDDTRASSIESHLIACDRCRTTVGTIVPTERLDRMWSGVVAVLDAPRPGVVERALTGIRVPEHVARLLAATPSLRLSWFAAEAFVLTFAVVASTWATGPGQEAARFAFLMLGALLPVAGIAVAFGPGVDPTYEIGLAAPMRSDRLLLLRAAAVLIASVTITGVAALAMPGLGAAAAAWLLPSLGLSLGVLAVGTVLPPIASAVSVASAWLTVAVIAAVGAGDRMVTFRAGGQLLSVVAIVVSAVVLLRRHTTYEERIDR